MSRHTQHSLGPYEILSLAGGAFIISTPIISLVAVLSGVHALTFAFGGLFGISALLFAFVRWINRRDDPEYSEKPQDDP